MFNYNPNASLTNMPNMSSTLNSWEIPMQLIKVTQTTSEGDVSYNEQIFSFRGVLQPLKTEELLAKPEGQRSWNYYWIHTNSPLNFQTADKIIYQNTEYKITGVKDYTLNGFRELEVILDYQE